MMNKQFKVVVKALLISTYLTVFSIFKHTVNFTFHCLSFICEIVSYNNIQYTVIARLSCFNLR